MTHQATSTEYSITSAPVSDEQDFFGSFSSTAAVQANVPPAITNLHGDSVAWAGVGNTVTLDSSSNAILSDAELSALNSGNGNWAGASLTVQRSGTAVNTDVVGLNTVGALFTVSGNTLKSGGQTFATFTLMGGVLAISFTSSETTATTALVQDVARHVTYRNDIPAGDATVRFRLSDGTDTTTADVTVTSNTIYVTNASDTAVIDPSDGVSLSEALALAAGGGKTIVLASSLGTATINLAADATVPSNTTFVKEGSDTVTISGHQLAFDGVVKVSVPLGAQLVINSAISGAGSLEKLFPGSLVLGGANDYTGATTVSSGTLAVTGALDGTGGLQVSSGATLAGTGTISAPTGGVTVSSGGTLSPGIGASAGKLTINGDLTLNSGAILNVQINGTTPGSGYDQVEVNGTVNVDNARLVASHGYTAATGDSYQLIDNDAADPIVGTFRDLAEGSTLSAGGNSTQLKGSYASGTGNDFTLSAQLPPTVTSIVRKTPTSETTNADVLVYRVTFSETVTHVNIADFSVSGGSTALITSATSVSGSVYDVTVAEGNLPSYNGTVTLGFASGQDIQNSAGMALASTTPTGTNEPTYALDNTPPTTTVTALSLGTDTGRAGNDMVTSAEGQIITATFGSLPRADEVLQIQLFSGGDWMDANAAEGNTLGYTVYLPTGEHPLKARLRDAAGNTGPELTRPYVVDDTAPVFASASVNGSTLTLQYTDDLLGLDDVHPPGGSRFTVTAGGSGVAVTAVAVNSSAKTVTLTLASAVQAGAAVTVAYTDPSGSDDANAIQDVAGNDAASLAATAVTNNTQPPSPGDGGGTTAPPATTIDGVPITTTPGPGGSVTITIPVVQPNRPDTPGSTSPLADIPLAKDAGGNVVLQVSVPTGVGLQAQGVPAPQSGAAALDDLVTQIQGAAGANAGQIVTGAQLFAAQHSGQPLLVQTIAPTMALGAPFTAPLAITGSSTGLQALVIDTHGLPQGSTIVLNEVDFAAILGAVNVVGGAGNNHVFGDGAAQTIIQGPGDDIIHGGAGNDVVGSEAGDDQVYGDAGDDIVFGGAGNDLLSGGTGSDKLNGGTGFDVAIQEGARTDYTVVLEGAGIKLTHTASGVSDWLVDVEQVRFASGPSLTVAHSAAEEAAAFLFQKWLGRDLTQSEGAIIQTLTGQSAEQVATLFAQFFPSQAAGKTTAQLLDGMANAGAMRVDAVRDVIVSGDAGNNTITPTLGLAKMVDGGAGIDTVVLPAALAQTFVQHNASGTYTLQRLTDGAMLDVTNVERVSLNDTKLALDLNGHAGEAARLLGALAGPGILSNKAVVGEVIRLLDAGATSQTIAGLGLQLVGASTSTQIAQTLWTNIVGRAGTAPELKILTDIMAGGVSAAELVVMAAHLDATAARIDLVGLAAKGIEFA